MKRILTLFLFLTPILFNLELKAQDTLIIAPNEVMLVDILEIGTDEIKYKPYGDPESPVFVVDKETVVKIITQEGKEYTFLDNFSNPELYVNQRKNALKFGLFSPLFSNLQFSYERSIKPGRSMEFTLGVIGIGADVNGNNPWGAYVKAGYKFINTPSYYLKGMRYSHLLKGFYVKPELIISVYAADHYSYNYYNESTTRETKFGAAAVLNLGYQWVFSDVFLIDLFGGVGFGVASDGDEFTNLYGFMGGYNSVPFAITGGFKIGFLFE